MKITIFSKLTGKFLAENGNIETLKHDNEKDELYVNDILLKNASSYEIKVEL